jgi:hypothetical protein
VKATRFSVLPIHVHAANPPRLHSTKGQGRHPEPMRQCLHLRLRHVGLPYFCISSARPQYSIQCGVADLQGRCRGGGQTSISNHSEKTRGSREFRKFLAGAFFVSAGTQFYFYLIKLPVPMIGTDIVQPF